MKPRLSRWVRGLRWSPGLCGWRWRLGILGTGSPPTLQEVHNTAGSRLRMSQGADRNQRWRAGELAGFGRGGGNGRLGGISVDFELDYSGDTGNSELDGTSGEGRLRGITSSNSSKIFPEARHKSFTEVGVWVGLPSMPANSTRTPSRVGVVAGSRTWSDMPLGSGSRVGYGSDGPSGSLYASGSGSGSVSVVGTGIVPSGEVKADWALGIDWGW
ncbi:hypothetical protein PO909_008288 [Leuciscus waleckii]